MGKLRFIIRKSNGKYITNPRGESLVYLRHSHNGIEGFYSTGVLCKPEVIDLKSGTLNSLKGIPKSTLDSSELESLKKYDLVQNKKLVSLKKEIGDLISEVEFEGKEPTTRYIKECFNKGNGGKISFWSKFDEYDSFRKANDKKNTYRQVPTLRKSLSEFEKLYKIDLDFKNLELATLKKFTVFLANDKSYAPNTVGYHIKALKTFLNSCISEGVQLNFNLKDLKKPTEIKSIIFLTEQEILKMFHFDYEFSRHRKAVDLFTLQCFTGFRISDFKRITVNNIADDRIFMHRSVKTDKPMQIPIFGPTGEILGKYDYELPKISEQNLNKYIKEAAKISIPKSKVELTKIIKNKKEIFFESKHKVLTTHVAVKTFVNMLYRRGVSVEALAKMTGKSVTVIRTHYLQFTTDEASEEVFRATRNF